MSTPAGIHVDDRAADRPGELAVVLVHGAPDRSKNFGPVVELLADLPLITYDRRGYGRSIDAMPARDFGDHADDLIAILDGRRAVVAAQSVGCNVAMTAAARAPELVAALGLWEPPTAWVDWWPTPDLRESASAYAAHPDGLALGEEFNRWMLGDERWDGLAPATRDMLRREGLAFRTDMASEVKQPFSFDDLTMPVVVGCGTATSSGHHEGGIRLAALLGADLYEVEGADHFTPISNPPAWAELVRRAVTLATR